MISHQLITKKLKTVLKFHLISSEPTYSSLIQVKIYSPFGTKLCPWGKKKKKKKNVNVSFLDQNCVCAYRTDR